MPIKSVKTQAGLELITRSWHVRKSQCLTYFFNDLKLMGFTFTSLYLGFLASYLITINNYEKALNEKNMDLQVVNTSPMLLLLLGAAIFTLLSLTIVMIIYSLTTALIELKQELILNKAELLTKLLMGRTSAQLSREILMEKFMMMPLIFFFSGSFSCWLFSLTVSHLERMFLMASAGLPHFSIGRLFFATVWLISLLSALIFYYYWLKKKINKIK